MCEYLAADEAGSEAKLREYFQDDRIALPADLGKELKGKTGADLRKFAKRYVRNLVEEIAKLKVSDGRRIQDNISEWFIGECLKISGGAALKSLFLPILK